MRSQAFALLFSLLLWSSFAARAQQSIRLKSPDGQLVFRFHLTPLAPVYRVDLAGQPVIAESTEPWGPGCKC